MDEAPEETLEETIEQATEVVEQLSGYGDVLLQALGFLLGAFVVVVVLNQIAKRLVYPRLAQTRVAKVAFGTLYAFILVLSLVLLMEHRGHETGGLALGALLLVALGGGVSFFLLPFLPTLPFKLGHMVELNGALGIVDTITPFHTHLRTFDGNMVFIPNALVLASRIVNYHHTPTRRVELALRFSRESDLERAQAVVESVMRAGRAVLDDPEPVVLVTGADGSGVDVSAWCWVENAEWMATRSEVWSALMTAIGGEAGVGLAVPRHEIALTNDQAAR